VYKAPIGKVKEFLSFFYVLEENYLFPAGPLRAFQFRCFTRCPSGFLRQSAELVLCA
jgi:hypothetical protein